MKVLHLEDCEQLRCAIRRSLSMHYVTSAATAEEAIHLLAKEDWDLLISDWNLDGHTAGDAISLARDLKIPVLLLSAETSPDVQVDAMLFKGSPVEELTQLMSTLVEARSA